MSSGTILSPPAPCMCSFYRWGLGLNITKRNQWTKEFREEASFKDNLESRTLRTLHSYFCGHSYIEHQFNTILIQKTHWLVTLHGVSHLVLMRVTGWRWGTLIWNCGGQQPTSSRSTLSTFKSQLCTMSSIWSILALRQVTWYFHVLVCFFCKDNRAYAVSLLARLWMKT